MIREVERDRKFALRVEESSRRVLAFKKKWKPRGAPTPTSAISEKLSRRLWEFTEEIHIAMLDRGERSR